MDPQPVKEWECSKCPKTFTTNDDLKNHVITHDPDAKVESENSGQVSKNEYALTAHVPSRHTERVRPSCDICHKAFSRWTNLRQHIDAMHSTSQRPRFPCTFTGCEKTYQKRKTLSQHEKTEHAENPVRYPCTDCGKEFKRKAHLEQHIPSHTTEKPYNCATCGKSFARKGDMKSHEMTHLEKSARDRSPCLICGHTFLSKAGLRSHIRVVHENQRNYPCTFCDKRFYNSSHLKRHVEAIHQENKELVHSCDKCEFKTNSEADLALHGKQHEPGNDSQESLMSLLSLWEEIPYFSGIDPTSSD